MSGIFCDNRDAASAPLKAAPVAHSEPSIYMDYQATTPLDPRVMQAMRQYWEQDFGNPHSTSHVYGWRASDAIEESRAKVAALINARDPNEIVFTSGATEANNMAIKGVARFYRSNSKNKIITVTTEHKCVLNSCRSLENEGFEVVYLPVNNKGLISLENLKAELDDSVILVSVMWVNNEMGAIQPIAEIGALCRDKGVFLHVDAAQAYGKLPIDVQAAQVDLLSISAHKIYGPKGVGALYMGKNPRVRMEPLIDGGGQERGVRSGTLPTPLVVGFGEAAVQAGLLMQSDWAHVERLGERFLSGILDLPQVFLNGDRGAVERYPGCVNISFAGVEGESMMSMMPGLAISSGSACTSESLEPSYVLHALGVREDLAHCSLRFGFGRFSTEQEVDFGIARVRGAVDRLREMSPLWELLQKGVDLNTIQWTGH